MGQIWVPDGLSKMEQAPLAITERFQETLGVKVMRMRFFSNGQSLFEQIGCLPVIAATHAHAGKIMERTPVIPFVKVEQRSPFYPTELARFDRHLMVSSFCRKVRQKPFIVGQLPLCVGDCLNGFVTPVGRLKDQQAVGGNIHVDPSGFDPVFRKSPGERGQPVTGGQRFAIGFFGR